MKRLFATLGLTVAFVGLLAPQAQATTPPCPSPTAASDSRTVCTAAIDPDQAALDLLKARLGGDVAKALDAEHRLSKDLDRLAAAEQTLSGRITHEESVIADLEHQIAQLEAQISDTQDRIEVERQQVSVLARAIYREPESLWLLIARTGDLKDALVATADVLVAGQRAHALQTRLETDLLKLQTDRQKRQDQLDRENANMDMLVANLSALQEVISRQSDVGDQLADLVSQIEDMEASLQDEPPDVMAALAGLLESQEQDLILRSYQQAWSAAQVGAGLAMIGHALPLGQTLAGFSLAWPMSRFQITQPFGPTDLLLEPPLGPYRHFHTGIDIAAASGTPVTAAAAGVVVAVGHGASGYGNYTVIAHGGGIETLYGHLLRTDMSVGQVVVRGEQVGLEGSTGFSTGPHLHFELRVNNQVVNPMPYLPVLGTNWSG